MDFKGQHRAEFIYYIIILIFAVIGFIYGYFFNSVKYTFFIHIIGTVIAFLVCTPNWPVFNRNSPIWLKSIQDTTTTTKDRKKR